MKPGLKNPPVCRAGGTRTRTYERPLIEDGCPFLPLRYTARVRVFPRRHLRFQGSPSSQSMMSCKSRGYTADKAIQPRCSRSFVELVPVAFSGDVHGTEQFAQPFNLPFLIIGNVLICQSVLNQFFVAHGHQFFFCFHCCPFL